MGRRLPIIAVVLVGASLTAASGAWFWGAWQLRQGVDVWAERHRAAGREMRYTDLTVGGFPFAFRLSARDVVLDGLVDGLDAVWSGPNLVAETEPWGLDRWLFTLPDTQELTVANKGGAGRVYPVSMAKGSLALAFNGAGQPASAQFSAEQFRLDTPRDDFAYTARSLRVDLLHPDPAAPKADEDAVGATATLELDVRIDGLTLPTAVSDPFGRDVARLLLAADLIGPVAPAPTAFLAANAWRDAGGVVEIRNLTLDWGPMQSQFDGTLSLDAGLQPIGAGTATIAGHEAILDALVARGRLKPGESTIARVALGLFARTPEGGGEPVLRAPVAAQDGRLYIGPLPLLRIPTVRWD